MLDFNKMPKFKFTLSCECGNSIQIGKGMPLPDKEPETEEDVYNCKRIAGFVDWSKFDITVGKHTCVLKCKECCREISIVGL
jgi:hypothetical protein